MSVLQIIHSKTVCGFLLTSCLLFAGCQPEQWGENIRFDGQRAFAEVEALVQFTPRDAGTPNGWKAANHITERLKNFGVPTKVDTFTDRTPDGEKTMRNVVGRIPGKTDQWIILGSHFDTMPGIEGFQGANDSGSSTGVLLELARLIQTSGVTPDVGLVFAFFDGEEGIAGYIRGDGLHGSRRMASSLALSGEHKNIKAMILLDMVGDKDLNFTIPYNSSRVLVQDLLDAAHATGNRKYFSLSRSVITDDHVPFLEIGIAAIDIIDFRYGSEPGINDHWHTDSDSLENISADSLQITGETVLQLLKHLIKSENTD